jgi:outer membrane protein assembly factor BamB
MLAGRCVAFLAAALPDRLWQLELASIDPTSGEVLARHPLVELRQRPACCRAVAADGFAVAGLADCLLACDAFGDIHWVRERDAQSAAVDALPFAPLPPPIAREGRVFVARPDLGAVDCLEIATGNSLWRQPISGLVSLAGFSADTLIASTTTGWSAIDSASGASLGPHDLSIVRPDSHEAAFDAMISGEGRTWAATSAADGSEEIVELIPDP